MMVAPVRSSPSNSSSLIASTAFRSATPPPGTTPSSSAARAAWSASSTRCFFSFISVSVAAPPLPPHTPAGELRQPLLQLLAVEVGVGVLDLGLQLLDPTLDPVGV